MDSSLGKIIRRIRQRLDLNMTAFGERIGVSHASVSQYEAGKSKVGRAVLKHLMELAETDEEREVLSAAMGGQEAVGDNIISEIRKASGMNRKLFAVRVGASERDLDAWEAGKAAPEPSIITKLKSIAADCGRGDLAMTLSGEDWTIKAVFHPGEKFISQHGKESPAEATRRERLYRLVDEILASENDALIGHAEMSLDLVKKQVVPPAKADGRKKVG